MICTSRRGASRCSCCAVDFAPTGGAAVFPSFPHAPRQAAHEQHTKRCSDPVARHTGHREGWLCLEHWRSACLGTACTHRQAGGAAAPSIPLKDRPARCVKRAECFACSAPPSSLPLVGWTQLLAGARRGWAAEAVADETQHARQRVGAAPHASLLHTHLAALRPARCASKAARCRSPGLSLPQMPCCTEVPLQSEPGPDGATARGCGSLHARRGNGDGLGRSRRGEHAGDVGAKRAI